MKQDMTIKCVKCGFTSSIADAGKYFRVSKWSATGFQSWCQGCMNRHKTEIKCRECGFSCPPQEAHGHFYHNKRRVSGFDPVCAGCKRSANKSAYVPREPKKAVPEFKMGSCVVQWQRNGRCAQYLSCKRYDSCLDKAAELGWPGWRYKNDGV